MHVISWNIQANRSMGEDRLGKVVAALGREMPDVLLLQEVGVGTLPDRLRRALSNLGLISFVFSGDTGSEGKRYGNVVASKWPVRLIPPGWAPRAPWPQMLAWATVTSPLAEVDVFVAHIPNGSGNGWRKIETFEALAEGLGDAPVRPRILGGDFNEPMDVRPDGQIIPFGGIETADGTFHWEGQRFHPKSGDECALARRRTARP